MLDPKLRRRSAASVVRVEEKRDRSNVELVEACFARLAGKLSKKTRRGYRLFCLDAIRYFTREDGNEIPAREWTKAQVKEYVNHAENGYCGSLRQLSFRIPVMARCRQGVWTGLKDSAEAVQRECSSCELFRPSTTIRKRLHALNRFFAYLAGLDLILINFVGDVIAEWYAERPNIKDAHEKKRNPMKEEMLRLVNGTAHPARRAFYALSAKWGLRPNEMLMLDRYASFGIPTPEGLPQPLGFEEGFPTYPKLPGFHEGGQMVYLPYKVEPNGQRAPEKRTGNRWLVIDAELRPIVEQLFAWWDRTVKRDPAMGRPLTTRLWLRDRGTPEELSEEWGLPCDFNARWFYGEAERLGLMVPGDRENPRRRWAAHCQRHFFEQVCSMAEVPGNWPNIFRGDAVKDSRGEYFKPRPEQVLEKYLRWIPRLGFNPMPDAPRLKKGVGRSETETHHLILSAELERWEKARSGGNLVSVEVRTRREVLVVPFRVAPSVAFALRAEDPDGVVLVDAKTKRARSLGTQEIRAILRRALAALCTEARPDRPELAAQA